MERITITLELTKEWRQRLLQNSVERVINSSIEIAEKHPHRNADVAGDWEDLKPIVRELWNKAQNQIHQNALDQRFGKINRNKVVCGWSIEDFETKAKELGVSMSEQQLLEAVDYLENRFDGSIGVNWDTIENAIQYVLGNQK